MSKLRVLDGFAGLGGASAAFKDRGHDVVSIDLDPKFGTTIVADLLDLTWEQIAKHGPFDFAWWSPPCNCFSPMTIGRFYDKDARPKRGKTRIAMALVEHTLYLNEKLAPHAWMMENPTGMLRTMPFMAKLDRRTVTYCQYGMPYRKSTDLWGAFPPTLHLRAPCKQRAPCHMRAPRGARAGIQGVGELHDAMKNLNRKRGGRGPYNKDPTPETSHREIPLLEPNPGRVPDARDMNRADFADLETDPGTPGKGSQLTKGGRGRQLLRNRNANGPLAEAWAGITANGNGADAVKRSGADKAALRALVPYELSLEVCLAMEAWEKAGFPARPRQVTLGRRVA